MKLIKDIQKLNLVAVTNQQRKLDDGTIYQWADEEAILDVLAPALNEHEAYIVWTMDTIEQTNRMTMSVFQYDNPVLTRTVIIGETRSNNDFTARCTTIRRDMLAMMFMIKTSLKELPPPVSKKNMITSVDVPATSGTVANVELVAATDTTANTDKTANSELFNSVLTKVCNAKTNDALMVLKDNIEKSKKLTADEKMELFDVIAEILENGPSIK